MFYFNLYAAQTNNAISNLDGGPVHSFESCSVASYEPDPQVLLGPSQLLELIMAVLHNAPQLDPEASLAESIIDRSGPQSDRKSDSLQHQHSQKQAPQKKNRLTVRWGE